MDIFDRAEYETEAEYWAALRKARAEDLAGKGRDWRSLKEEIGLAKDLVTP